MWYQSCTATLTPSVFSIVLLNLVLIIVLLSRHNELHTGHTRLNQCMNHLDRRRSCVITYETPCRGPPPHTDTSVCVNSLRISKLWQKVAWEYWHKQSTLLRFVIYVRTIYDGVSKSSRTGCLERELQMAQLNATRCSFTTLPYIYMAWCLIKQQIHLHVVVAN